MGVANSGESGTGRRHQHTAAAVASTEAAVIAKKIERGKRIASNHCREKAQRQVQIKEIDSLCVPGVFRATLLRAIMPVTVAIQTTPNAPRSEIIGWMGERLKVKVKAPAVEGKANAELVRFLAAHFGVRPNAVTILRGDTARLKVVRIDGLEESDFQARL